MSAIYGLNIIPVNSNSMLRHLNKSMDHNKPIKFMLHTIEEAELLPLLHPKLDQELFNNS